MTPQREVYRVADEKRRDWAARLPPERRDVLLRVGELMNERKEEILDWLIREARSTRLKALVERHARP